MSARKKKKPRAPDGYRQRSANIPGYKTELETAEELGLGVRTLRKWRTQGIGPSFLKIGRVPYYTDKTVAAWLKSREVQPVRSTGREVELASSI
jgi:hypothetical protein